MPLVAFLLGRAGLISSKTLSKNRKYAIVLIFILAAIITPTPDAYNMTLMAGPLVVLYEISVLLLRFFGKPK